MREEPSQALIDRLERLGLARGDQVRAQHRQVRRLARGLPLFESVWIDALARVRVLTPYQAAELNAGRGESLKVGPFVLTGRIASPGYADCFSARQLDTGRMVRLAVARASSERSDTLADDLKRLVFKSKELDPRTVAPVERAEVEADRVWLAGPHVAGRTAAEWLVENGRFPPQIVLEIARQMVAALAAMEKAGVCHGDLALWNLIVDRTGQVILPQPGVRGLLRPGEGYAQADLPPEAYDYLAPERITQGTPPTVAADIFATGLVWWHLLAGRPARPGGTALAKLRAAQKATVRDVREFSPDTSAALAEAIAACTRRAPQERPASAARLAAMLGAPSREGRLALARYTWGPSVLPSLWTTSVATARHSKQTPIWLAAVAGCLLAAVAVYWVGSRVESREPGEVVGSRVESRETRELGVESNSRELTAPGTPSSVDANESGRVVLDVGPARVDRLTLSPGQVVSGPPGKRAAVLVPPHGLAVEADGVRFENVDFYWQPPAENLLQDAEDATAMVELRASRAEFSGCSFQAAEGSPAAPAAVRWVHPTDRGQAQLSLPSGRVLLTDCVLRGLRAGVDCRTAGAVAVECSNVLCLGAGPLVALDHCPAADEPILLRLANVTLRGPAAVLACRFQEIPTQPGRIRIEAQQCVFVSDRQIGLLRFAGPASPQTLLESVEWTGDGSLVSPLAAMASWQPPDGSVEVLDDSGMSVAGLVRGEVEFAGPPQWSPQGVAASTVTRWQAPIRSTNPPGADPRRFQWAK